MNDAFLLYGATGYTGQLTARLAAEQGLRPILAGRNADKVHALAAEMGLERRAFALEDQTALDAALRTTPVVLHCAGPYIHTYGAMAEGCLRTGAHYLDISGEIAVYERLWALDGAARAAGVMLMPSVGFDVVPSDCLAAHLEGRLPSATRLALGFQSAGGFSRGSAMTAVEVGQRPGMVRRDGVLTPVPAAWRTRTVDFGAGPTPATTIPWGDVFTAYHTTGIPNIEVYVPMPAAARLALRSVRALGGLMRSERGKGMLRALVRRLPDGPDEAALRGGYALLWGEASDDAGNVAVARMRTPHTSIVTALAALLAVKRVLNGEARPGFQTPAGLYGPDLALEIPGVTRTDEIGRE
jgi:short subunit dehydrogenase-like uncharacterized protein